MSKLDQLLAYIGQFKDRAPRGPFGRGMLDAALQLAREEIAMPTMAADRTAKSFGNGRREFFDLQDAILSEEEFTP